jgi:hypothetical protein
LLPVNRQPESLDGWSPFGSADKNARFVRALAAAPPDEPDDRTDECLDDLVDFIRRYVVLEDAQADALALWVAHGYVFDAADATPYLNINSPEKESGKTRLLEVLELLAARPWLTGRVTAAALARKIDAETPTLLLDESDAAFNGEKDYAEALRGILNTGHRRGGKSSLCVGQGAAISYVDLSTFAPKAIAGLGKNLPDTVASRSIPITLKRKAPHERVERFRRREAGEVAGPLTERARLWAEQSVDALAIARPHLPDDLGDRAQDCWEPLFAIAEHVGGDWPERARAAAIALSGSRVKEEESIGVRLLTDCKRAFGDADRITTAALRDVLAEDEEAPWGDWRGKGTISARSLAKLFGRYGIHSRTIRLADDGTAKGYLREQFEDAWTRYLACTPSQNVTASQPASIQGLHPLSETSQTPSVTDKKEGSNPHETSDVTDVTDKKPDMGAGRLPGLGDNGFTALLLDRFRTSHILEREMVERLRLHEAVRATA